MGLWGLANLKCVWQAGNSGESWCCSLESEFQGIRLETQAGFFMLPSRGESLRWETLVCSCKASGLLAEAHPRYGGIWRVICSTQSKIESDCNLNDT